MFYLVIFIFPILINSQVLDTDLSNGLNAEGVSIKYLEGSSEPFKGNVFNYYPNGNRELKGNYLRGLKEGKWVWWYPNGEKNKLVIMLDLLKIVFGNGGLKMGS